jgi:ABC-type antimicrobial peptide transport system permease subunit
VFWTYLTNELRRRRRQAILVALGLGVGIALVMVVSSLSSGVSDAQSAVLHRLYGVGTDVTVTNSPAAGSDVPFRFGVGPHPNTGAGRRFSRDRVFVSPGEGTLSSSALSQIAGLPHVSAASPGLALSAIHISGKLPSFQAGGGGGFRGGFGGPTQGHFGASNFNLNQYSVEGVNVRPDGVGPLTASDVSKGRFFRGSENDASVAIVSSGYARQRKLSVGSKIDIGGGKYTVIGVASDAGGSTDVYVPLARAQSIAGAKGVVSTVYVRVDSASNVGAVQAAIKKIEPKVTVTTASSLASQVTGSLSSASSLAGTLGKWLAIVVLVAAFALASLLTLAAVSRRVREFGTLKALGWRSRRLLGQVMGETVTMGIFGAIIGVALGVGGSKLVARLVPSLTASLNRPGAPAGGAGPPAGGAGPFARARAAGSGAHTLSVHLSAPLHGDVFALAVGLAIAGGLIAGSLGGWRAARLRPAVAMRRLD